MAVDDLSCEISDPQIRNLYNALNVFAPDVRQSFLDLTGSLDDLSLRLARDAQCRHEIGETDPAIWQITRRLWEKAAQAHEIYSDDDASQLHTLSQSLAKFTRNLVAAEPPNQEKAFENERHIRALIHRYTSYAAAQDMKSFAVTRMLVQALSNLVTANDILSGKLWTTYLNLPEDQLVLLRLFESPDPRTVSSTFVLILNCLHRNREHMTMLVSSPRGPRLCICMLDRLRALVEAEGTSDEEAAAFDVGDEIFTQLFEQGLIPEMYNKLAVDGEIITPHQTTLLKLLDAYLHRSLHGEAGSSEDQRLVTMLVSSFFAQSLYAQQAIRRATGSNLSSLRTSEHGEQDTSGPSAHRSSSSPEDDDRAQTADQPLQELDLLFPKVCEALILVAQCLTTITLDAEEAATAAMSGLQSTVVHSKFQRALGRTRSAAGEGLVESLIETLRLLDVFIPRITFGKVVQRPTPPGSAPVPQANLSDEPSQRDSTSLGFKYVKRDLTQLLGVIVADNRDVQDRVRECGGIPVVMNLCVIDDQNPYLKEHAILTLRNLLHGNRENQSVVHKIQPVGRWDENHVLQGYE